MSRYRDLEDMTVREALEVAPPPPTLPELRAKAFEWERVYSQSDIQQRAKGRTVVQDVSFARHEVRDARCGPRRYYGDRDWELRDGVQFDSGECLVACCGYTFAGTFASHDNFEVRYYWLTPRAK